MAGQETIPATDGHSRAVRRDWTERLPGIRSIAARKRAEEDLRASAQRLQILFESAPDAYYLNDLNGNFVDGNHAAEAVSGYQREELIGKSFLELDLLPEDQIPRAAALLARNARGEPTGPDEFTLNRQDGKQIPLEIRTFPVSINGEPLVLSIARDITDRKRAEEELREAREELEKRVKERTAGLVSANKQLQEEITERKQAEEELRESEERYRTLVETARDVIYTLSTDGVITSLNRAFEATTGWSRAEWLGKSFASLPHPDDLPRTVQNYQRALRGEVPPVLEARIRSRSGEYLTTEIAARPLLQDGEVVGTLGIARDITARRQAEEALRDSEERYRRLSEAAFEGIGVTDSGRIVDANKQLAKMFGYNLAEVIGMHALDFTAPESRDLVSQRIKSQYEKPYEHLALRKDGSIFPIEVRGKSIPHRGRSVRVTAIRDITERKRAEEALRDSEQRFRLLVETVNAIPWELDLDTWRFTYVGPQAVKLLGYPLEDWYGEAFWVDQVHPEDREQAANFCREATARSEDHEFEYRMLAADGRTVWLGDIVSVVLGESGPKMLRGIMVDISERKRAEEALQTAREELEGKVEHQLLRRNPYGLTFRELTVLHLVAAGRSDREIGATLVISHLTAQKHISNILAKMGAASRTEASVRAVREGLLD